MPQTSNLGLFLYLIVNQNIQTSHQIDRLLQHGIVDVDITLGGGEAGMSSKVLKYPCPNAFLGKRRYKGAPT